MLKIRFKSQISLNSVAYTLLLIIVFFRGYFSISAGFSWASALWNGVIIVILLCVFLDYLRSAKFSIDMINIILIGSLIFMIFLAVSYFTGENRGYAWDNFITLMKIIVIDIAIMVYARNPNTDFFGRLKRSFWLFNAWGFLNMVVLTLQINIRGFMMPTAWLSMNSYYPDLCAGLFGFNGTHILATYMTFLFIYNQYIAEFEIKKRKDKRALYAYNIILLLWHFILSTQNDNMTIYLFTLIVAIAYFFMDMHWRNSFTYTHFLRLIRYISFIVVVVIVVLMIPSTRDFILNDVLGRIINLFTSASNVSGSTERISILIYTLENGFGYQLGKGIGYYPIIGRGLSENIGSIGFRHFGISSMSSMVYLVGIWFYIYLVIWIGQIHYGMGKKKDLTYFSVIMFIIIFMTFYSTALTNLALSISLTFLFAVFSMMWDSIEADSE